MNPPTPTHETRYPTTSAHGWAAANSGRQLILAALIWAMSPVASLAQQSAPAGDAQAKASPATSTSTRIIDVEATRRLKQREQSFKVQELPLFPFVLVGRGMEKGLTAVEEHHLMDKAQHYMNEHEDRRQGIIPVLGDMGVGSGLALGVKYYRNNFLREGGHLEVPAKISTRLYQEFGLSMRLPMDKRRRIFFDASAYYRLRTQDNFFGLGNDSRVDDRTSYLLRSREIFFGPRVELPGNLKLVTRFGYRAAEVLDGWDGRFPAITNRFDATTVPGLAGGAREWISGLELICDRRDVPGRPHRGGYYSLAVGWHRSAESNNFAFWRYEINSEHYIPLGSRNRTLALRFQGVSNQPLGGSPVPFFEETVLGGRDTLRGFAENRFHDLNGVLMTAEYRYNLNSYMDVVTFVDAGQVAHGLGDFRWGAMHTSYGAGLRFLTAKSAPFRIVLARSAEGWRVYLSFSTRF